MEHFESKLSCSDLKAEIRKLLISIPKNLPPPKSFPKHITNNYLEKKSHAHTLHLCIIALERAYALAIAFACILAAKIVSRQTNHYI